jgi:hypothetical protein
MLVELMKKFDKDMGWSRTKAMSVCQCGCREKSHRPISRKCSLCNCSTFVPQKQAAKSTAKMS